MVAYGLGEGRGKARNVVVAADPVGAPETMGVLNFLSAGPGEARVSNANYKDRGAR